MFGEMIDMEIAETLLCRFPVLIVDDEVGADSAVGRKTDAIVSCLKDLGVPVIAASSLEDGTAALSSNPDISCVLFDWDLVASSDVAAHQVGGILYHLRRLNPQVPVFLLADRSALGAVPLEVLEEIQGYIWILEDTADFVAGRIEYAVRQYLDELLPPFFRALVEFAGVHEYSWHTPGHSGGTAFMKTAVGRAFQDFYGEEMLRSDLSISVEDVGSLNDHSGPVADAERFAAQVFGADQTYFVVGGSSASNQMVLHSCVTDGDVVLVDRNCHKSINYALNMCGAVPVYLMPTRNARGIIGPVHRSELEPATVRAKLAANPLVQDPDIRPVLAVLTNSTYDGLCYDVEETTRLLGQSVDRIHYDEAWYGYARFNPLYRGRLGMYHGARSPDAPTVTVTQSTHKLLAALSQASMVHVREGRAPVVPALFNESFMMHTSTSPQYAIIASLDVAAKMMHDSGRLLTDETIREAVDFRQEMLRIGEWLAARQAGGWWFETWQADTVDGKPFVNADSDTLETSPQAWGLHPGQAWHGYGDLGEGYCMLDPIKVTILTPGVAEDGQLEEEGIPATLVSAFLATKGIVVEKTETYSFLVLFSMGLTKGKWGSLVASLMQFKELYDAGAPLVDVLPELVAEHPARYRDMSLPDLAGEMHQTIKETDILGNLHRAFENLPEPVMRPRAAFEELVRGHVEQVAARDLAGRTLAVQVVPYPPGIPILMPGERFGPDTQAVGDYLLGLQGFDARFPGFGHDIHGVEVKPDEKGTPTYYLYCLTEEATS
jgi:arginine decarboxylase